MKKLFMTGICLVTITISNVAFGADNESGQVDFAYDASNTLQATRSMVYSELKKNMQTSLYSMAFQEIESKGSDEIKSYARKESFVLGHLSIEG